MLATIVVSIMPIVVFALVKPFALQIVLLLVKGWTQFYTAAAPEKEREARRAEIRSDLYEQVHDLRADGHTRSDAAVQFLYRSLLGLKDDLAWSAPHLLPTLADKLKGGSASIKRFKTPPMLVPAFGSLLLVNWVFSMSDHGLPWVAWPLLNGAVLAVTVLFSNHQRSWARRALALWVGLGIAVFVGFFVTMVLQHRLYEAPLFREQALGLGLAALSVAMAMVVVDKQCRARFFGGRWWPVLLSWSLIVAASLGVASLFGDGLQILLASWAVMALMAVLLAVAAGAFTLAAAAGWYGSLWGSAAGMRWVAAGIRRLT